MKKIKHMVSNEDVQAKLVVVGFLTVFILLAVFFMN